MKSIWRIEYLVGLSKRQSVFNTFLGNRWKTVNREICTVSVNREKIFRERQQELNMWHQTFWEKQNETFYQSKKAFLKVRGRDIGIETKKDFADDLSKFYKNFLDGHYQVHSQYLRVWYLRNFQLLWMALQVSTTRFFNKVIPWRSR
ncbi:COA8 family protein CBG23705, mitochondrial-like isoform X3 [Montipora foliosa]|uniref:COA8 family protein CBG23705, mitochondrial-like isoform X3 n=1 Tax=Montipora foliosa TaxID=591990 RepID=UPI0035F187ED